jgi:hypothetical protein
MSGQRIRSLLTEGLVIVVSILLAFGIDAMWEESREREAEAELLVDLLAEFALNREELVVTLDAKQQRIRDLEFLIGSADPTSPSEHPDSLVASATRLQLTYLFRPEVGAVTRATTADALSLIRSEEIRDEVSGFWDRPHFFENQQAFLRAITSPDVIWDTGRAVWQDFPEYEGLGSSIQWERPLTPDQARALKFFAASRLWALTVARQGEEILAELDALIALLEREIE